MRGRILVTGKMRPAARSKTIRGALSFMAQPLFGNMPLLGGIIWVGWMFSLSVGDSPVDIWLQLDILQLRYKEDDEWPHPLVRYAFTAS